ncbi:geranylgeranyl diphosphate synthase type I [Nocardia tenerifensis]|uniref:Geranylgeranyl diphosphate synthase type I n=2 Tax=Nocardia tenerifensis TaxID=228006 RepID=A0A318JP04_9NOCA|nr:polyprenyl synthetase family protein [Nocardia tenerifensis]PXX56344.1 geranylgeranyl diphosphate synthase type I [Nocardia tenerifensis]
MSTVSFDPRPGHPVAEHDSAFEDWYTDIRARVTQELDTFLGKIDIEELRQVGADTVLRQYVIGGKCLRSTFLYLGWLCGAEPDPAALRAAASLELLHGFALLQDDVMDDGALRRGSAAAQVRLADRHRARGLPGSAARFGGSAATLLGDMCLVWAEQLLRDSGLADTALARVWPRYDAMRIELAVGQLADLANDVRAAPTMDSVLAIARAKSGNYTVLRPLELGAALAGCPERTLMMLGRYGTRVGEAFQLRDDLLGVFGSAAVTGKPEDSDLGQHKATSVVVAALAIGDRGVRTELRELLTLPALDAPAIDRCRELIAASGAPERIEDMIAERVAEARAALDAAELDRDRRAALADMALLCTARQL